MKTKAIYLLIIIVLISLIGCDAPLEPPSSEGVINIQPVDTVVDDENEFDNIDTDVAETEDADSTAIPDDTDQTEDDTNMTTVPDNLTALADEMLTDAQTRTSNTVTLKSVESVTWNDGALGCPDPEKMYTMSIVEGYKLIYTDGSKTFQYHTSGSNRFIYCENPPDEAFRR